MLPITLLFLKFGIVGQIVIIVWTVFLVIFPLFILPRYVSRTILYLSLDAKGFQFDCVKPYWGSKIKAPLHINWDELKSYKYEPSYNFTTFKLRLVSGKTIKFHRWFFDENDDFDKFMNQFKRTIKNYNQKKSTEQIIEREKLIMENRTFLITTGIVIGMILIAALFLLIFKGISNVKGILSLLGVIGPLIWVMSMVIKGLKK